METISCRFAEKVGKVPLPEYPRPQFVRRDWLNLNGEYDYAVCKTGEQPQGFDGKILVPFALESKLSGVQRHLQPDETLWYRRYFTVPEDWDGRRVLLHFGAVDDECEVFVNGKKAGEHRGGYNPFTFDITELLSKKENELAVKVTDPTDQGGQQRGKQASESHGFWYTATSGIWQTVWLEPVGQKYLDKIKITPDVKNHSVILQADVPEGCRLRAVVCDENEKPLAEKEIVGETAIPIASPRLWSPEDPYLYSLLLFLTEDDHPADAVLSYFGMREFSIAPDEQGILRLCLNGKPYFQTGLLDQGYWCDSGLTPPSDEAMIYDIEKMKSMGFNMLRKHIKVEPARWYYHCDRLGMLVWQDMVSGGDYVSTFFVGVLPNLSIRKLSDSHYKWFKRDDAAQRERFKKELFEMIDSLYNCVSICCWVPFNEGWGQFDALSIGKAVKQKDPTRFVDHASGWHDQGGPDFVSIHRYILPVTLPKRDEKRPFVLSEFGGYSQIIDGHVWNKNKSFGYMMFPSKDKLTAAVKKLYEKQIIPLVPKGLAACVYTQVSDVEFEVNGLLTYDRRIVKVDEDTMRSLNEKLRAFSPAEKGQSDEENAE